MHIHNLFDVDNQYKSKVTFNLNTYEHWQGLIVKVQGNTMIINQVLNTRICPDKLKITKVIPIFKKDDPILFKNYRPISLLIAISKVQEHIICTQLSSYFNEGFRPKHCTEYAALELVERIINYKNEVPINRPSC